MKAYSSITAMALGWMVAATVATAGTAQPAGAQAQPAAAPALHAQAHQPQGGGGLRTEAEVVAAVLESNLSLGAARTGAAADAQGPAQVRWPFPMVEVMPMVGAIRDGEPGAQVMARQAIPWPARLSADRAARAGMAAAADFEADARAVELVAMARMAYAELWGLQEQADRMEEFGRQLQLYREAALAQYAAGRGPQQAVLGIQVEGGMLAQRLEALAEQQLSLNSQVAALTGGRIRIAAGDRLAPPAVVAAGAATPPAGLPAGAAAGTPPGAPGQAPADAVRGQARTDAVRDAVATHPMLEAGRAMQSAEEAMAEMNRTMLRPDFTIGVNLNLSRMAFDRMYGQEPVMPAIGVMLPLWRGGVRARIQEAELRATQRELETADARVQLEAEVEDVLGQLSRVRGRIATYEGTLRPQVRQTLDAGLAGYQAGTTRFLELLDAQRMALDIELDLIMARVREAELVARLDAATGRTGPAGAAPAGPGGGDSDAPGDGQESDAPGGAMNDTEGVR
jgi:outer membrane protein, heavy metal efflux system